MISTSAFFDSINRFNSQGNGIALIGFKVKVQRSNSNLTGNCLSIVPGRQYDRVYCGAACPESHETFIKQFVRVGGILVMPYKDHLLRVERVNEDTWMQYTMLPVSFATLVVPSASEHNLLHLRKCNLYSTNIYLSISCHSIKFSIIFYNFVLQRNATHCLCKSCVEVRSDIVYAKIFGMNTPISRPKSTFLRDNGNLVRNNARSDAS